MPGHETVHSPSAGLGQAQQFHLSTEARTRNLSDSSTMNRIVVLLLIAAIAAPAALWSYYRGAAPYGNGYLAGDPEPCLLPQALPAAARVVPYELASDAATMQLTTVPLGIVCTVQLAVPRHVEVISYRSWPRTIAWLGLSAVAALSV